MLKKKHGAGIQSFPVESSYTWKGKIEKNREYLCIIKTTAALYGKLEKSIKEIHPYEVPEIVAIPAVKGSSTYLEWISSINKLRFI